MRSKKAQSLGINIIIIFVIGIIILVVMTVMVMSKYNIFGTGAVSCSSRGGECFDSCAMGYITVPDTDCTAPNNYCCIPLDKQGK